MKLSKILDELSKGNSVKFFNYKRTFFQIQRSGDKNEVIFFNYLGQRRVESLKKNIYTSSKYIVLDKKGLKELGFKKDDIKDILKHSFKKEKLEVKVFKRPIRKSAGAKPINDSLEKYFEENSFSFLSEFKTYRIRIRSIADYISIEDNEVVVYEVKSDVDSFVRLVKQVKDYLTYADKVYIVLHEKKVKSFLKDYSELLDNCGLIVFSDNDLVFEKEAPLNNPKHKFKLLLSKEELSVFKQLKGYTKIDNKYKCFKKIFSVEDKNRIISNVLSSRFDKRRNKIYTEGEFSLDISNYQEDLNSYLG